MNGWMNRGKPVLINSSRVKGKGNFDDSRNGGGTGVSRRESKTQLVHAGRRLTGTCEGAHVTGEDQQCSDVMQLHRSFPCSIKKG